MNVVIDTSVALAWYLDEPFSPAARNWQKRILAGRVHAMVPALHILEFSNVLRTYVRRREMTRDLAEEVFALHLEAPLDEVEPPRAGLLATALEFDASVYDAAFILLAQTYDCPLVTAERTTRPWVVKLGEQAVCIS